MRQTALHLQQYQRSLRRDHQPDLSERALAALRQNEKIGRKRIAKNRENALAFLLGIVRKRAQREGDRNESAQRSIVTDLACVVSVPRKRDSFSEISQNRLGF